MSAKAPWQFGSAPPSTNRTSTAAGELAALVSAVPADVSDFIKNEGLQAAPVDGLRRLLPAAQIWLGAVPELEGLVLQVVRHIHPLAAEPGYDVSHSQPRWRDRILVSCPERADGIGALRLAEGVLHEAMHLHLTNEEALTPLVAMPTGTFHSPWRRADRPVQGVLHGLFVFACIHRFLELLVNRATLADEVHGYVADRVDTVAVELAQVDVEGLSSQLTTKGRASLACWLSRQPCPAVGT